MPTTLSYYFSTNPPYLLCIGALLAGLACGSAFETTLREMVEIRGQEAMTLTRLNIQVPYVGITISVGFFLGAGLEIFGFPPSFAYAVALPLTLGSAYFVWRQLGKLLVELERGGSAAMDLDRYEE
ncbi:MAG: hypothetical protein HC919_03850 [Oscillatoriales cyanobacterium SM2_2_1]|nr:hypothetical protein [Oscillatoriales cyanobacterium SM2_2_1]